MKSFRSLDLFRQTSPVNSKRPSLIASKISGLSSRSRPRSGAPKPPEFREGTPGISSIHGTQYHPNYPKILLDCHLLQVHTHMPYARTGETGCRATDQDRDGHSWYDAEECNGIVA